MDSSRIVRVFIGNPGPNYDPSTDHVVGAESMANSAGERPQSIFDPFGDGDVFEQQLRNLTDLINWQVREVAAEFNDARGLDMSEGYWRLLLLPWICELTQRAWWSYQLFSELRSNFQDCSVSAMVQTGGGQHRPTDTKNFMKWLYYEADYNNWLDSRVLEIMSPAGWQLVSTPAGRPTVTSSDAFRPLSYRRRLKFAFGHTDVHGAGITGLALAVFANLLPKSHTQSHVPVRNAGSPPVAISQEFLDILASLRKETLPSTFGDDFGRLRNIAKSFKTYPGRLRLGAIDYWNDLEKVISAEALEKGERLIHVQHGGFYGLGYANILAKEGELKDQVFFSWGFESHEDATTRFVPLGAPVLSRLADSHRFRDDKLILVGDAGRLRSTRATDRPRSGDWFSYVDNVVKLISLVPQEIRKSLYLRPYNNVAVDIDIVAAAADAGHVQPVLTGDLHAAMKDCSLLVLMSFGTTFNFALAMNTPFICVCPPNWYRPCQQAVPYIRQMEQAGMVFRSAADAALAISDIQKNPQRWWNDPERQRVRVLCRDYFARTSKVWPLHWAKALWDESRAPKKTT